MSNEELDAITSRLAERDNLDVQSMWEEFVRMRLDGEIQDGIGPVAFIQSLRRQNLISGKKAYRAFGDLDNPRLLEITMVVT